MLGSKKYNAHLHHLTAAPTLRNKILPETVPDKL